jgi:hypothetical protein
MEKFRIKLFLIFNYKDLCFVFYWKYPSASIRPQVSVRKCRSASVGPQVAVRKYPSASVGPQVSVRNCPSASVGPQVSNPQVVVRKCRITDPIIRSSNFSALLDMDISSILLGVVWRESRKYVLPTNLSYTN